MSDFVRKRIEALNNSSVNSLLGDAPGCYDCISSSAIVVSTNDSRNEAAVSECELIHKGCPICIACFAGFNPNEQVAYNNFSVGAKQRLLFTDS